MSCVKNLDTIRIRVFLTSRPEVYITSCFPEDLPDLVHEAILYKVAVSDSSQNDITRYLTHELAGVRRRKQISEDWPGQVNMQKLAVKADGLFIYAATACRFLDGPTLTRTLLDQRLDIIFGNKVAGESPQKNLDAIYTDILRFSVLGDTIEADKNEISRSFKQVVGSIVVLFEPLSPQCLSTLLDMPLSRVEETLKSLHSLLAVPEKNTDTIQLLHISFGDFLTDSQRCLDNTFCISEATAHEILFQRSIEIMSTMLRRDICCLQESATELSSVEQSRISQHIPVHLQYACRHWVYHLQHSRVQLMDNGKVHQLLQVHLFHWLEALSLLSKIHEGVLMVLVLSDYLTTLPEENTTALKSLVHDARRFVLRFRSVIEIAPLQIYTSALAFCPKASVVRGLFGNYLPRLLRQILTVDQHWESLLHILGSNGRNNVVFSPNGKLVASSSGEVWETLSGTLVRQLEPWVESSCYNSIEFSEDSQTLIYVHGTENITKWDIKTGRLIFEMDSGYSDESIVVLSRSHEVAATACGIRDSIITIIDIPRRKSIEIKGAHPREIMALELSPDGAFLASASMDQTICLWDTTTAELQRTLKGHRNGASDVTFSSNGQLLASADMDSTIYLWCAPTGALLTKIKHSNTIQFLAFSPDSSLLAFTDSAQSLSLCEADTGAFVRKIDGDFCAPLFSPNGDYITSTGGRKGQRVGRTNGIKIWETKSGSLAKAVADRGYHAEMVSFSPVGTTIASTSETGVRIWDSTTKAEEPSYSTHTRPVYSVVLLSSGERALSFAKHDSVMLWDVSSAELLCTIRVAQQDKWGVSISPDGTLIAAPYSGTSIGLFDTRTGTLLHELLGHTGMIRTMVFRSDSMVLASASFGLRHNPDLQWIGAINPDPPDSSIRLWNARTGELLHSLAGPLGYVECLSFSPDGETLAVAYADGPLHLWNTQTGKLVRTLIGHEGFNINIVFSPDGNIIASTARDRGTRLWNVNTAELVATLYKRRGPRIAKFSPNGELLASVSYFDKNIELWNPATGELLAFRDQMVGVNSISFSEDGEYLDTGMGRLSIEMLYPGQSDKKNSKADTGLFVENPWVLCGTKKILLLPPEYYATCACYRDGVLMMGHENGRVSIIRFEQEEITGAVTLLATQ